MRDLTGRDWERLRRITEALEAFLAERGYSVIETPLLEETELFVRKSGGELTSRLYTFTDPGGHRVSLRPEFTSSVIRHFIQERGSLAPPIRWQYNGPVFRYEPSVNGNNGDGGLRQFIQAGAEVVGAAGVEADADMLALAWSCARRAGLSECSLRVGHIGVLQDLLGGYRLSETAKVFIIGHVSDLKGGNTDAASLMGRARSVGLLRGDFETHARTTLENLENEAAHEFMQGFLTESMTALVGRRTPEQIVSRLLRKARDADDPSRFERALRLVAELARLDGPAEAVLAEARRVVAEHGLKTNPFDKIERLFEALERRKLASEHVTLDLGYARGISYYTGVIFEVMHPAAGGSKMVSLGGGGRYDGLVKALGGDEDVPALGFAYYVEQMADFV